MACVLTGMLVFMGTSYVSRYWTASRQLRANLDYAHRGMADINADWALFKTLQRQFGFLGGHSPVDRLRSPLRTAYAQAGAQALESYDSSSDSDPRHFDWQRAELCLTRAQELGLSGPDTLGKLALTRGYAALATIMDSKGSDSAALFKLREDARDRFAEAARDMPQSPDPHLGLARIYIYSLPSLDNALAEFQNAARLGYRLGPREIEQQGDAFRLRGIDELRDGDTEAARQHFDAARGLYSTIPGYHWADYYLRQIPDIPPPAALTRERTINRGRADGADQELGREAAKLRSGFIHDEDAARAGSAVAGGRIAIGRVRPGFRLYRQNAKLPRCFGKAAPWRHAGP